MINPIKSTLQKIKPKLRPEGRPKLDKLWMLYKMADYRDRQDIEQRINKLAVKYGVSTIDDQILLPPPTETEQDGDISIGAITYLDEQKSEFKLKTSELTRHLGIFGYTGTGKTTLARNIIRSLVEKKIPFIIFDWETSYRSLAKEYSQIKVYTVGKDVSPFKFNFFNLPPGIDYQDYVKSVIEIFSKCYVGGVGSDTIMKRIFDLAYQYDRLPKLDQVKTILDGMMTGKAQMRGREMLWKQSVLRMIEFMLYGSTGAIYNSQSTDIEPVFNDYVIFELGGLSYANDKHFFTEILTLWYMLKLAHKGTEDENLKHVLIFEEFHNIVYNSKRDDLIQKIFRIIRKYGTGIIAIDQEPCEIPNAIFENMGTKVAFAQTTSKNVNTIAGAMFLDKDQRNYIGLLRKGEAIVRTHERSPYPFMVTVPFTGHPPHITDEEIRTAMKPFSELSTNTQTHIPTKPPLPPGRGTEYPPSSGEQILLQDIAINPYNGTDQRYKNLGLTSREGNEIKEKLTNRGFLIPVSVDRKTLYALTDAAKTYLTTKKFEIPSQARGGIEHNYWLEQVKERYKKRGFPFKEKDDIDLVIIELKGETETATAVQIETGKSNIEKNIETLIKHNFDHRFMLATSTKALAKIQKLINDSLLPGKERIQILTAKKFLSHPS